MCNASAPIAATGFPPASSDTLLKCSRSLARYMAALGTVAVRPPNRIGPPLALASGVVALKSMIAVPGVDAVSSDNVAP